VTCAQVIVTISFRVSLQSLQTNTKKIFTAGHAILECNLLGDVTSVHVNMQ
jgi:hypothetical protein